MDLLLLGFGGLVLVCLAAGGNFFATAKMKEKIHATKHARRTLNDDVSTLQAALISKREEKKIVVSKLRMARIECKSQKSGASCNASGSAEGPEDKFEHELINQKVITPRELERVKKYRRSTSCPYGVAETIVMLGYATKAEVDQIAVRSS
ncbi:hypothetical protein [Halodesulfovibrio sp.]|jgi:hypothetical protein|uniref:hypothetical protein n=1 Tax=Halodesulfovibrio sp. TaxID=1912772 RepID=UPI0025D6DC72|nr:hypothetical protein [Halodesulfovibrio sp.]MCT4628222.1 hypothetical protein [Halodesulfovibrio sp.]